MTKATDLLKGSIDPHVHAAPDIWNRSSDVIDVARDARKAGMSGVLLVNHFSETAGQAAIVDRVVEDIDVRGAIKLNRPVGGLNPDAVEVVLELGAAKVDMPTQQSTNELSVKGECSERGISVIDDGELREEVFEILELVKKHDRAVATGHLASAEVQAIAEAAFDHGIDHPVVSHPELPSVSVPQETQVELAERGAMMEYCYVSTTEVLHDHYDLESPPTPMDILDMAAAVGPESVMLATDFGQPTNPSPTEGMHSFIEDSLEYGFSEDEVELMVRENARSVYDFD